MICPLILVLMNKIVLINAAFVETRVSSYFVCEMILLNCEKNTGHVRGAT